MSVPSQIWGRHKVFVTDFTAQLWWLFKTTVFIRWGDISSEQATKTIWIIELLSLEKSIKIKSSDKMSEKESYPKRASGRSHCLSEVCSEKSGVKTAASPTHCETHTQPL